ncbi:PREDICTED: uncharacterized protein LOC108559327 [Nicrophorus vespilloides]|uniref:Uncharacterized protein LOC108559327 n=1 Tax=Nicrophorus vespilloides TaxID=110193 RepID=A0ABM1MBV7_NICVS|nr:PREDICTED: uncharacterized protein LOC108559327 [Nicrophorus vespilloides]
MELHLAAPPPSVADTSVTQHQPHSEAPTIDVTTPNSSQNASNQDSLYDSFSNTMHYLSPMSPLSARTVHEGDYYDYMEFLIEPLEKGPLPELSTISSSYISCVEPELQRTIAIIKPEAMCYKYVVLRAINEVGFQIVGIYP